MNNKEVLIVGSNGQLASELMLSNPIGEQCIAIGSSILDISSSEACVSILSKYKPKVVINAAAYTAVDTAEQESEKAFSINAGGVKNLSMACKAVGAKLIHISTDFVFDGEATQPYTENETTNPINVYGKSKLAGEQFVNKILPDDSLIIRTSWVYSEFGKNFLKTMLYLMGRRSKINVVSDQFGCPTSAKGLSQIIWMIVQENKSMICGDIYNWSDKGIVSWFEFASKIYQLSLELGLLKDEVALEAIPTEQYPTAASRPKFSALDTNAIEKKLNIESLDWDEQLKIVLQEMASKAARK